jgi:hypothetical protein
VPQCHITVGRYVGGCSTLIEYVKHDDKMIDDKEILTTKRNTTTALHAKTKSTLKRHFLPIPSPPTNPHNTTPPLHMPPPIFLPRKPPSALSRILTPFKSTKALHSRFMDVVDMAVDVIGGFKTASAVGQCWGWVWDLRWRLGGDVSDAVGDRGLDVLGTGEGFEEDERW